MHTINNSPFLMFDLLAPCSIFRSLRLCGQEVERANSARTCMCQITFNKHVTICPLWLANQGRLCRSIFCCETALTRGSTSSTTNLHQRQYVLLSMARVVPAQNLRSIHGHGQRPSQQKRRDLLNRGVEIAA